MTAAATPVWSHRLDRLAERAVPLARVGLAARTGFYLVLCYLTVAIAVEGGGGKQANAHGALDLLTSNVAGVVLVAVAVLGFAALGLSRLVTAARDSSCPTRQRASTGLQGVAFLVAGSVALSFLLGRHSSGSEGQQQHETSQLLGLPGGQIIVIALGIVVLCACAWQIRTALSQDFTEGIGRTPGWARRAIVVTGTVGIVARALVFGPLGLFLIIAAVQANPAHADGLDAELATLARHSYGLAVLAVIALGLLVFAAYSALETRYRELDSSR